MNLLALRHEIDHICLPDEYPENMINSLKQRMHQHVDRLDELQKQLDGVEDQIKCERAALKDLADKWGV